MSQCSICGVEEDMPFTCNYCDEQLCADHRLPENHSCPKIWIAKMRRPQTLRPTSTSRLTSNFKEVSNVRRLVIGVESKHILIAWTTLSFAFSIGYLFRNPLLFPIMVMISLGTVGLGFILHELSHKFIAQRYGYWAEFRVWPSGLIMAVIFAVISLSLIHI